MNHQPGRSMLATALLLLAAAATASQVGHDISFDSKADFRALRTFTIGEGEVASRFYKPEIDNRLFLQRMRSTIRAALTAKGLTETTDRPDLAVSFRIVDSDYATVERRPPVRIPGSAVAPGLVIPGGPQPQLFVAGTLVIDLTDSSGTLVWRGTWHERERSGPRLSRKLSEHARKLLSGYPPKRG